jgi:hypothetical protein
MLVNKNINGICRLFLLVAGIALLGACASDSDDDSESFVKFYNASYNAPSIYMTLDEDIDNDYDDEFEATFSAVAYASAGSRISLSPRDYFLELAWQSEDSSTRSDLEIIFEDQITTQSDVTKWIVLSDTIQAPTVSVISIPDISDEQTEQDQEDDVFNLRLLNLHPTMMSVDVYLSKSDETFNESNLISNVITNQVSDNYRLDEDQYTIYLTQAGSDIVLFTSDEINYAFGGQHLIAIRENFGSGGSPFIIDNMTNTQVTEYSALESRANISIYNGLDKNPLVPEYEATINAEISGVSDIPAISELEYGSFSDVYQVDSGDYRFKVENAATQSSFLQNRVLSLPQNTNRSLFLYWTEEEVDDDNDGNVDENDDGIVDEIRPIVSSLVVDNSERFRLYDKELTLLNLVNTDEFSLVKFYFVKSDEIIETATNTRSLTKGFASSIILLNNTYQVFVLATIDNNDIILDELTLTLSEESQDLFLILEHDSSRSSGYAVRTVNQVNNQ